MRAWSIGISKFYSFASFVDYLVEVLLREAISASKSSVSAEAYDDVGVVAGEAVLMCADAGLATYIGET
jgi:hydrogenase maturation factor HypE